MFCDNLENRKKSCSYLHMLITLLNSLHLKDWWCFGFVGCGIEIFCIWFVHMRQHLLSDSLVDINCLVLLLIYESNFVLCLRNLLKLQYTNDTSSFFVYLPNGLDNTCRHSLVEIQCPTILANYCTLFYCTIQIGNCNLTYTFYFNTCSFFVHYAIRSPYSRRSVFSSSCCWKSSSEVSTETLIRRLPLSINGAAFSLLRSSLTSK